MSGTRTKDALRNKQGGQTSNNVTSSSQRQASIGATTVNKESTRGMTLDSDTVTLKAIWDKLVQIEAKVDRIPEIEKSIQSLTKSVNDLEIATSDLERRTKSLEEEASTNDKLIKDLKDNKADKQNIKELQDSVTSLQKQMVDMSNRSRRNNIVIHNLPEGYENYYMSVANADQPSHMNPTPDDAETSVMTSDGSPDDHTTQDSTDDDRPASDENASTYAGAAQTPPPPMERFIEKFLAKELGIHVEIDAAHRTGTKQDGDTPRPIHARCLRREDRDKVLKTAPTKLRGRKFRGNSVFLSDDIDPVTRDTHKRLVPIMKDMRENKRYFAYIPWSVPRVIKYKEGPRDARLPLKTYKLRD